MKLEKIKELDKNIPGRKESCLLKKKSNKHLENREQLLSLELKDGDISGS